MLVQEREQCREVVKLLRAKIDEVKAGAQAKHEEYWQAEQAYRQQRIADRARRDAEWAATKAERDAAYKARQAELAGEPFNQEVGYEPYNLLRNTVSSLITIGSRRQPQDPLPAQASPALPRLAGDSVRASRSILGTLHDGGEGRGGGRGKAGGGAGRHARHREGKG